MISSFQGMYTIEGDQRKMVLNYLSDRLLRINFQFRDEQCSGEVDIDYDLVSGKMKETKTIVQKFREERDLSVLADEEFKNFLRKNKPKILESVAEKERIKLDRALGDLDPPSGFLNKLRRILGY
ncbi:MAG: hypothetical protein AABW58_00890 [Nanoarchaeota archaeon]